MKIPSLILKQMYTLGSLENVEDGVRFSLKNRLSNATLTKLNEIRIDDRTVPLDRLTLEVGGDPIAASQISPTSALAFPLAKVVRIHARTDHLEKGQHDKDDDYTTEIVRARQKFVEEYTGVKLQHIDKFSFDPGVTKGNIKNFT